VTHGPPLSWHHQAVRGVGAVDGEAQQVTEAQEVVVVPDEFGVLVQGPSDLVESVVERLMTGVGAEPAGRTRLSTSDAVAVGASGFALARTSGEYLRLAPESVAKLQELGLTFEGPGVARHAGGQIAAHLDFESVSLAAEQALALQTVAVTLALRSAIANVQEAVERVEGKVDRINQVLSARLKGDVIGTYRELLRVVTKTNKNGFMLPEDWDGVASVRLKISQDLETLRAFVHEQAGALSSDESVPKRQARLRSFTSESGHVSDVLSLIVVAEKSLQLYEYLKIQAVQSRDPALVPGLVEEARDAMAAQRMRDEELILVLRAAIERVRLIEPLEVHRIFSKKDLDKHARQLDARVFEFAEASVLTSPKALGHMPEASWSDARADILGRVHKTGRAAKELGASVTQAGADGASKQARKAREEIKRRF
jgi:hypothetical protein